MSRVFQLMPDKASIINRNVPGLPITAGRMNLSDYMNNELPPHWNDDITIIKVIDGNCSLQMDEKTFRLNTSDIAVVQPKLMHRIFGPDHTECAFLYVLASPELFSREESSYFFWKTTAIFHTNSCFVVSPETENYSHISGFLEEIVTLSELTPSAFPFRVLGNFYLLAADLLGCIQDKPAYILPEKETDFRLLQNMLDYIHSHFQERISLDELAAAGTICRSKCCNLFRQYLKCTPTEYINNYRLSVSRHGLADSSDSIASIAQDCGFGGQSYYTKLFTEKYGYTPGEYRSRNASPNHRTDDGEDGFSQ